MSDYVKVLNGAIVWGPAPLPKAYTFSNGSTTGNFDLLDADTIKAEGFLPVVYNMPSFDPKLGYHSFSESVIQADNVDYNYIVNSYDINAIKNSRKDEVIQAKDNLLYNGNISYNNKQYATDLMSINTLAAMASAAMQVGAAWSCPYKAIDGSWITLAHDDILAINAAINTRVTSLWNQAMTNENDIDALTTISDVVNFKISMS